MNISDKERTRDDRVSDIARSGGPARDRAVGGHGMSADIISFRPRQSRKRGVIGFSVSAAAPDDLVMNHADTAPCEYVAPDERDPIFAENTDA
jgi:hypothetical protein